jgi:uncharacterized membrane protein
MHTLLVIHVAATWFMVGLVWFVQVVHYPLFRAVGEGGFPAYEWANIRLTSFVAAPVMLLELATGVVLLWTRPDYVTVVQAWLGMALLGMVWLSTVLVQARAHRALAGGFDQRHLARLLTTNWIRTVGWTSRGVLVLWMLGGR